MKHAHASGAATRRRASLSLDPALLDEARALEVNLSRAAEDGIASAVRAERERRWRAENAEAIESSNAWVERHGPPLARWRRF